MQVVIVGGSLSGLIHAIVFKSLGHDVHVLEKSSADLLRSQAAGLSAGPDVRRFISEYIKPQKPYAKTSDSFQVVDLEGRVVNTIPTEDPYHMTTWSLLYNLFKTHLLDDAAPLAKYETEKWVRQVKPDGHDIAVVYSDTKGETLNTLRADLVIAADGAHSAIRQTIIPNSPPQYVGYVTWRGAVPAAAVSEASRKALQEKILIFRTDGGYTLSYHVPSESGSTDPEDCQFIWVWYEMLDENSHEFQETFTDNFGKKHSTTVPRGKVDPEVWAKRQRSGAAISAPFAELIEKTTDPFVSAIRESSTPQSIAHDGKILLVGDAFCLFRPHVGASTNQAARQALELADVFQGHKSLKDWEASSMTYAKRTSALSVAFGEYCFTGNVPRSLSTTIKPDQQAN